MSNTLPSNLNSNQSVSQPETNQEVLGRLEKTYVEKVAAVNELRAQVVKLQEQLVEAHTLAFKALQTFSNAKEQYLISIVNSQKSQIEKLSSVNNVVANDAANDAANDSTPAPVVQPSVESRTDNLA